MTVGVAFSGNLLYRQTAQLLGIKVPPKIDSANFSDSNYLQFGKLSINFTKLRVKFCHATLLTIIL